MIRVAAFTGNGAVPGARFRARQYIPTLRTLGVEMTEMPCPFGKYPPASAWKRPFWGAAALISQIPHVVRSQSFDCVFLQREMISTLVTLEPFTRKPRVLDVDDAIFLLGNGSVARRLAQMSDRVLCGNAFLAEAFRAWNPDITVLPTAVDTDFYRPRPPTASGGESVVIGWIGTSSNLQQLLEIESALANVLRAFPRAKLKVVSDRRPSFRQIDAGQLEYVRWSESTELSDIQGMDIGIMPLSDSLWARGKCSFKMLQYMACGIPPVVSPVGMNAEVVAFGRFAHAASTERQWIDALLGLLEDDRERMRMGQEARRVAEQHFSVRVLAPVLAACLGGAAAKSAATSRSNPSG